MYVDLHIMSLFILLFCHYLTTKTADGKKNNTYDVIYTSTEKGSDVMQQN